MVNGAAHFYASHIEINAPQFPSQGDVPLKLRCNIHGINPSEKCSAPLYWTVVHILHPIFTGNVSYDFVDFILNIVLLDSLMSF